MKAQTLVSRFNCDATIESVEWNFGDGSSSSGSTSASHRYKKVGDFTVTVSVTVSKTIINEEGEEKTYTESGSDSHDITVNAQLKLLASPDTLPADGKSTTDLTIYVVDYRNYVVNSYNKKINLSSSNKKALSVPKTTKAKKGAATARGKAGKEPDIVIVTGSGSYLRGDSCQVTVEGAKLSYIEAVDNNDSSRHSQTELQMVSKKSSRSATITAYKDNPELDWAEGEPIWTGIVSKKGVDSVSVSTNKTGTETAEAGKVSKTVTIKIVSDKEHEVTIGPSTFGKFQDIFNKVASKIGGDKDKIHTSIDGSCKWYKVDQTESPLCQNTYEFSAGGSLGYGQKVYIPALSINFKFVKIGVFVEPDISLTLTAINIIKDGSLSPRIKGVRRYTASGGATLSGSVAGGLGGVVYDPLKIISVEADLKAKVGANGSFAVSSKHPTTLKGSYTIGKVTLSGMVYIEYRDRRVLEKEVSTTPWEGMGDSVAIDLSGYFNKN